VEEKRQNKIVEDVGIGRGLMAQPNFLMLNDPSLDLAPRVGKETFLGH
jgi:ABC-type branched-subunit amino acid transport system ATPase component